MTRTEFIENINTWESLIGFADENELWDEIEGIYDTEALDNYINRELPDYIREYGWQDVNITLSNIPDLRFGGYFKERSWLEFEEVTDEDFADIKDVILEAMEGYWDAEYDEDEYVVDDVEEEDDEPVVEEPFSIEELFSVCNSGLKTIKLETDAAITEANEAFSRFISVPSKDT